MEETYERVPLAVITGGEPLLQPGAVADIGNVLKAMGMMNRNFLVIEILLDILADQAGGKI